LEYKRSSQISETIFQLAINTALTHRDVNAITAPVKIGAHTLVERSIARSLAFVSILMRNSLTK